MENIKENWGNFEERNTIEIHQKSHKKQTNLLSKTMKTTPHLVRNFETNPMQSTILHKKQHKES